MAQQIRLVYLIMISENTKYQRSLVVPNVKQMIPKLNEEGSKVKLGLIYVKQSVLQATRFNLFA
jgi:hypothetical protein